jgi:serine kinase of HPr protein (carbohydrate metabolism regulator)
MTANASHRSRGGSASIHGSAAAWAGRGILLLGDPGSGKSVLLAQLLAAGAYLVADDLVRLEERGGTLYAKPAGATGLIEVRANGIFRVATTVGVPVNLCVELTAASGNERLPERTVKRVAGADLPVLRVGDRGAEAIGQILLALWALRTE